MFSRRTIIGISLPAFSFLLPLIALAAYYDTSHLPYSDAPATLRTAVAVSFLTEEGILQGYPDGTFHPERAVNRAEFLKIAMKLPPTEVLPPADTACFPDIDPAAWYAPFVCAAKRDGFVRGDALDGIEPSRWRFHPDRTVNYAEALKMLAGITGLSVSPVSGVEWYVPYVLTANSEGIGMPGLKPEALLKRGEVAELSASFLAYSRGELPALRAAQSGQSSSASSVSSVSSASSGWTDCPSGYTCPVSTGANGCFTIPASPCFAGSESGPSCGTASCTGTCYRCTAASSSVPHDPDADRTQTSNFLRLGTTSPVLGAAKIFNNLEPFDVTDITVTFTGPVPSVDQVRLYDSADGRYLGGASADPSDASVFTLHLAGGTFVTPKREERSLYARVVLSSFTSGGASGEDVQIDHFTFEGVGSWSTKTYSQSSTDTFSAFETARSTFTEIENAGPAYLSLVSGTDRTIGSWRFSGMRGDGSADLRVTDIAANLGTSGIVTLTNIELGASGLTERHSCSLAGSAINCTSIPDSFTSVSNGVSGSRLLTLYADIDVSGSSKNAGVQVSLTPAGTPSSAGAITWTDGTTSFDWVPFDQSALQGTYYSQ